MGFEVAFEVEGRDDTGVFGEGRGEGAAGLYRSCPMGEDNARGVWCWLLLELLLLLLLLLVLL